MDVGGRLDPCGVEGSGGVVQAEAVRVPAQHLRGPSHGGGQPEQASLVEPAPVQVACRHPRRDAAQGRMATRRREELGDALVREPVHAHAPVALGSPREPFDRLVPVLFLVAERIELPFGGSASPDVLHDDHVSVARKPHGMGVHDGGGDVLPVGLPHQQRRGRTTARRQVMVRPQHRPVREAQLDVAQQADAVAAVDGLGCGLRGHGGCRVAWRWG